MNNIYWRLLLLALIILAVMIVYHWCADASTSLGGILPSRSNSPQYNLASGIICAIGVWGLVRLLHKGSG